MWDVVGAALYVYCVFMFIGLGPALFLFKNATEISLAVAPTLGLVLITVIGTFLVWGNIPIAAWGNSVLIVSACLSAILIFTCACQMTSLTLPKSLIPYLIGLFLCVVFLFTPILLGGLHFTVLRGNGSDTFNYVTLAGGLIHEPLSWLMTASTEMLVSKHPNYSLCILLANSRWSTSMILGWSAFVSHMPLYRFEFAFTAIFFVMTYSCAYCFATFITHKKSYAALLALAMCIGFFGQFILDIRAMSQIMTIPVLLFLVILIVYFQQNKSGPSRFGNIILGLCLAAVIMQYVEMLPTVVLGSLLFAIMQIVSGKKTLITWMKQYWLALLITLLALAPVFPFLLSFFMTQLHFAAKTKNQWEEAYFSWLYQDFKSGFWGFSIIYDNHALFYFSWINKIINVLSLILTGSFVYIIAHTFFTKNKNASLGLSLSIALLLAALAQVSYLLLHQQYWAAGKTFTFGYPFIFFVLISLFAGEAIIPSKTLLKVGQYAITSWLVIQCCLGYYRIMSTQEGVLYPNYMAHHGLYRLHDWNVDHIANAIKANHIEHIGLNVHDAWLTEYLALAFGWNTHVTNLNGMRDRVGYVWPKTATLPMYLVVTANSPQLSHAVIIARDPEFVLIKTSSME